MSKRLSGPALMLLELTLVSLIFCASAAVCTMLFARSVKISQQSAATTGAVFAAESAAETFKATGDTARLADLLGGSLEDGVLTVQYDENWQQEGEPVYSLFLVVGREANDLERAQIWVTDGEQELFMLYVARAAGGGV